MLWSSSYSTWWVTNTSSSDSPYFTQIVGYLDQYVRSQGYYMMLRCVVQSSDVLPDFATWNVDGAFLLGVVYDDAMMLREKLDIPAVFIDTYAPEDSALATVGIEDYRGGRLAAEHLLDRGHRRIAFVGPPSQFPGVMQERFHGFRDALRERGVELTEEDVFVTHHVLYDDGVRAGQAIAASPRDFTAVAAMADVTAFGVMEGLRLSGRRVPEDVSVMGFDDLPECLYSYPKLTSISQNLDRKAQVAGEYLFSMLRSGETLTGCRRLDLELAERQSVIDIQ